jgi:GNAT superfamily N-acetyltransferase
MTFRIDNITTNETDPFAELSRLLRTYNETFTGSGAIHVPIWLFARDAAGRVIGGLRGSTSWSWGFIDLLAVDDAHRKKGIGSALLGEAETIAKRRGCIGVYLFTASFQAPDFYPRHGYSAFGTLADHPPGYASQWFMKRL